MWQSVETLNIFNILTLKQILWKTKFFSKRLEYRFLSDCNGTRTHNHFVRKYHKPMLRQIECRVQNGPITKNGVLSVTTLLLWKFCFSLIISYKELVWCTNDPNFCIHTFCKRWSFILRFFFPVSIIEQLHQHSCY